MLRFVRGGGGGIRTLDDLAAMHAFQACALVHYATPPRDLPILAEIDLSSRFKDTPCFIVANLLLGFDNRRHE